MRFIHIRKLCVFVLSVTLASCGNGDALRQSDNQKTDTIKPQSISGNAKNTQNTEITVTPLDGKNTRDNLPNAQSRFAFYSCAKLRNNGASKEVIIGEFLAEFPKELFDEKAVEALDLSGADLTHITANLACAAALSGYGPDVPESALALFASKRHGKSAMAVLKQQANGSTDAAKAARQFADQMKSYLAGPGE